jgi:thiol-disulfide isomerase/thioredoxin
VDGRAHSLAEYAGAPVLVVFWACNHCPYVQAYEDRLIALQREFADRGVRFVAINSNDAATYPADSFTRMVERTGEKKFNYDYLHDPTQEVARAFGAQRTPEVFVFDAERRLRYQGGIDDHENPAKAKTPHLRNALDALLEGKPVPVAETRVFGCSTKWPHKRAQTEEYNARIAAEAVDLVPGGDLDGVLRAGAAAGKVRLVHYWKHSDPSRLAAMATMHHMYRRRNFELVTVALEADGKREDVLKALQKVRPAISAKNVVIADAGPPRTVLLSETGEELFRAEGGLDELACRRAIVRHLREDRLR